MMDVDPKYEYNAPQFVDFTRMDEEADDCVDIYFDKRHDHEDVLALSPRNSVEEPVVASGEAVQEARALRSSFSAKSNAVKSSSPHVQQQQSNQVQVAPTNLCNSLSKWRSKKAQQNEKSDKKIVSNEMLSRKSARIKAARDACSVKNEESSDDQSSTAVKRRRLNGGGNQMPNDARVTRSLAGKAVEPKAALSRSMQHDGITIPHVLPSTAASRSNLLKAQTRARAKALPRSLDVTRTSNSMSGCGNSSLNNKSVASAAAGKLRLTMPETPAVLKRKRTMGVSANMKTTEELELEKMANLQKELAKKIELNIESYRAALAGHKPEPVYAAKPATKPEEFHFETDSRIKDQPVSANDKSREVDFTALLRKNDAPSKAAPRGITKPKPFNLHHDKKRKLESEQQEQVGFKFETMAEKLWKFSTKTPERFRTKHSDKDKTLLHPITESPHLTVAKTPNLTTKLRARKTHVLSQAEREELEIEEMKKNQFRAQPLNEDVLTRHGIGVKKVQRKPATVPEPFSLSSDVRHVNTSVVEEEKFTFHANPVPKAILDGVIGVKPAKTLPVTVPQSPAFHTRQSSRLRAKAVEEDPSTNKPVFYHPAPQFSEPFKPQRPHAVTEVKPFSFEERTQEMFRHKQQQIKKFLQKEEEARKFMANPMPDLSVADIPEKPPVNITQPVPFELNVDARGELKSMKLKEKVEEEERKQREMSVFRARPPTVLQQLPFEPQRTVKPPVDVEPFQLSTELRAEKRADFERWRIEHEMVAEKERMLREQERLAAEEREVQRLRAEAVHRAHPVRHYKPAPPRQVIPLTEPQSPKFSERLMRSKSAAAK